MLQAYRLHGLPVPLAGGQGTSWRVGAAVVKPLDMDPALVPWLGALLARLVGHPDFRVSVPLQTSDGRWAVEGWTAWRYEPGVRVPRRWHDIIAVGQRLHMALESEPEPPFISGRTDRWAIGDRVAWGELPTSRYAGLKYLDELTAALRPVALPRQQLIHGDLTGNVLFHDTLPPLVIDLSLYWRPTAFASAIVIADALVFEGADEGVLDPLLEDSAFPQCLLRALIYRIVSDQNDGRHLHRHVTDPYRSAVRLAIRLAAST